MKSNPNLPYKPVKDEQAHADRLGISLSEYYRRQANRAKLGRIVRKVVAPVAISAAALGTYAGLKSMDNSGNKHFDKVEQSAVKEVQSAWNAIVVLREGATYRSAPKTVNPSVDGGPDTVAGTVKKGDVLVINNPIFYTENPNSDNFITWLGFSAPSEEGESKNLADPKNTFWINFSELERQNSDGRTYVEVYTHGEARPESYLGKVAIDRDNNFVINLGNEGGVAGLASAMPETAFEQMKAAAGLERSHGR